MAVKPVALLRLLLFCLVLVASAHAPVFDAQNIAEHYPVAREFFPAADRFGALEASRRRPQCGAAASCSVMYFRPTTSSAFRPTPASQSTPSSASTPAGAKELRAFTDQYVGKSAHDRITVGAPRAVAESRGLRLAAGAENMPVTASVTLLQPVQLAVAELSAAKPGSAPKQATTTRSVEPEEPIWVGVWRGTGCSRLPCCARH